MPPPIKPGLIPTSRNAAIDWLRLARSRRVGPTTFLRLLRQFGSVAAALDALPEIAAEAGERRYAINSRDTAEAELAAGEAEGATLLCLGAGNYPAALWDLSDPPPVLWAKGNTTLLLRPSVALVGARNASAVGRRMAMRLARDLGELGYIVVSGLARGIDAAAHEAALPTGTIAVQAGGIDVVYPKETTELTAEIGHRGLRLSEMPMGLHPQARHFPQRNRIISGLARAVIVVEGAAKSGSMITARAALDQGREVMAVPGHPMDARAAGCNNLIRDGAVLIRNGEDVHDALQGQITPPVRAPELPFPPQEAPKAAIADPAPARPGAGTPQAGGDLPARILALLGTTPIAEDIIIRETAASPPEVMAVLAEMDLRGQIDRQPGGMVTRGAA